MVVIKTNSIKKKIKAGDVVEIVPNDANVLGLSLKELMRLDSNEVMVKKEIETQDEIKIIIQRFNKEDIEYR